MTKITAKFSNGFEDVYNGTRNVKAAWMIVEKATGEVKMSGHSLDRARAAKTADGNLSYLRNRDEPSFDVPARIYAGANYSYLIRHAAKYGYTGKPALGAYKRWARKMNEQSKAAVRARHTIEVIDL